jgi:hypothetical protein
MVHTPSPAPPLTKGNALIVFFKYLKSQPRPELILEQVLTALPPAAAEVCRKKLIAVADYPYQVFAEFLQTVDRVLGKGDLALCRKLGEYSAIQNIRIITEMYHRRPRSEDFVQIGDLFWKSYHPNCGSLKVEDVSLDHFTARIDDFPRMDPAHCRLMEGWFSQAMVEGGGVWIEEVHEVRCASQGDPYHEFVGRWKLAG